MLVYNEHPDRKDSYFKWLKMFLLSQKNYMWMNVAGWKTLYKLITFPFRARNSESAHYYPDMEEYMPRKSWLDRAMMKYGGSFLDTDVEEVKTILKIMVIFAILIPYWVIYFQVLILNCLNDAYHL